MERRSNRISNHHERATKRQVHEKEEPIASQPIEAGRTVAITNVVIVGMGMSNHKKIISQL
jgi:glucose-6-phosphate isomerase